MSNSQATAPIANQTRVSGPLFPMGQIVATPAVADHFAAHAPEGHPNSPSDGHLKLPHLS